MFKKKYTSKEAQSVGKSNVKTLRGDVLEVIGKDNGAAFDAIVGKKDTITKSKYQCGTGASAFVYSVNDVPFFISVDRLSEDEQSLISEERTHGFPTVPTAFFFLRLQQLLANNKEQWSHFVEEAGTAVTCYGPTSRYLMSGAHLMMPGVVSAHSKEDPQIGDVALIYSAGVDIPYAVGFLTSNFTARSDSGVGVYVVQCFRDNLWQDYENRFVTNYSLTSHAPLLPPEFGEFEVAERKTEAPPAAEALATTEGAQPGEQESAAGETTVTDYAKLFEDEDAVLTFCLCEAVRQISRSMLPLPLPQFTSSVVQSYPRDGAHSAPVQFKDTKYKRALPFFQKFPELLTIVETSPGVHAVMTVNKSAPVYRQHVENHKEFLETAHREAYDEELRTLHAKLLESGTALFKQRVVSAGIYYAPSHELDEDLVRMLLLGDELNIPENVRFPTLEQVMNNTAPKYEPVPIDEDVFDELYTAKALTDNLNKYIQAHSLLVVNMEGKGALPNVKIDDMLSKIFTSKTYAPELPINSVRDAMLKLFRLKHEIVLQTVVEGSSLASDNLVPKRILKSGALPKVNVWSEKVTGSKHITIVRNLEALGFDLNLLTRQWKKQFSTSCSVVNPANDMKNLKPGTKIPLEIHVQGDLIHKVEAALLQEANLPSTVLVLKKN